MPSPVDLFFESVFGHIPSKDGAAYEQLSAIAMHVLNAGNVQFDARIRGEFSQTIYQIDALHRVDNTATMAEAKDYSARNGKVGRSDIQKLGGALPDIAEVASGAFFSATGYTAPARKYAAVAENISGKPIKLFQLRPSVTKDEDGFIQTIIVNVHIQSLRTDLARWRPSFTARGDQTLKEMGVAGGTPSAQRVGLSEFFDAAGIPILTLNELTSTGLAEPDPTSGLSTGEFLFNEHPHFIKVGSALVEIASLHYEIPFEEEVRVITISGGSMAKLTLADGNGTILSLINEHVLKEYKFDCNGTVIPPT